MRSTDISEMSAWEAWPNPLGPVPETPGVYALRASRCFGRACGESDIVYVGLARKSLRRRLAGHQRAASDERYLLGRLAKALGSLEVCWKSCDLQSDAMVIESRLLGGYAREHVELPPANRQQPLRSLQDCFYHLAKLAKTQVDSGLEERAMAVFR